MFAMPPPFPTTYLQTSRNAFVSSLFFLFISSQLSDGGIWRKASYLCQHSTVKKKKTTPKTTEDVVHGQRWLCDDGHSGNLKILAGFELPHGVCGIRVWGSYEGYQEAQGREVPADISVTKALDVCVKIWSVKKTRCLCRCVLFETKQNKFQLFF